MNKDYHSALLPVRGMIHDLSTLEENESESSKGVNLHPDSIGKIIAGLMFMLKTETRADEMAKRMDDFEEKLKDIGKKVVEDMWKDVHHTKKEVHDMGKDIRKEIKQIDARIGKLENSLGYITAGELRQGVKSLFSEKFSKPKSVQCLIDLAAFMPDSLLLDKGDFHFDVVIAGLDAAQKLLDDGVPMKFLHRLHSTTKRLHLVRVAKEMKNEENDAKAKEGGLASDFTPKGPEQVFSGDGSEVPGPVAKSEGEGEGDINPSMLLELKSWNHLRQHDLPLFKRIENFINATDKVDSLASCHSFGVCAMLFSIDESLIFKENGKFTFYSDLQFDVRGRITVYLKVVEGVTVLHGSIETGECMLSDDYSKSVKQLSVRLVALYWLLTLLAEKKGVKMGHVDKIGRLFLQKTIQVNEEKFKSDIEDAVLRALKDFTFSLHFHLV